jgi:hypothetical protein
MKCCGDSLRVSGKGVFCWHLQQCASTTITLSGAYGLVYLGLDHLMPCVWVEGVTATQAVIAEADGDSTPAHV